MIAQLRGIIAKHTESGVVIDVAGVGYIVHVSASLSGQLSAGQEITLITHMHITDQQMSLFGFLGEEQLWLFRLLLSVSGVGPKMAMNILNVGSHEEIMSAIGNGDVVYLTRVSGVGKRTAERVVVDLKDKVGGMPMIARTPDGAKLADVIDALIAMGYAQQEARDIARGLDVAEKNVEDLIREVLRTKQ